MKGLNIQPLAQLYIDLESSCDPEALTNIKIPGFVTLKSNTRQLQLHFYL